MENKERTFKQELISECKRALGKLIGLLILFGGYYLMVLCWLHAMMYLQSQFPAREKDINWLGIAGIGYFVLTFFLYMSKTFDRKQWRDEK